MQFEFFQRCSFFDLLNLLLIGRIIEYLFDLQSDNTLTLCLYLVEVFLYLGIALIEGFVAFFPFLHYLFSEPLPYLISLLDRLEQFFKGGIQVGSRYRCMIAGWIIAMVVGIAGAMSL
ncbi:hypothetical protein AUK40_04895 [Candidatus Wirthbacteria bacterium CG2_30_54_11]|uniref:Uncharacterized protein n=1 Tax=Candidatus Wirthbacteria bacterium CG2_30_54_11 TaxID=1817892 RepID=A0A1J5IHD3_9BACT|nr:MAG: hypothetical protein AUK40_04895 [Candidatus Wirthbacteria bacterium CG2_30_54_11]